MSFYQRNLPHWQPEGAEYFITFRLAGSLPKSVVRQLRKHRKELGESAAGQQTQLQAFIQRKIFQKYEAVLDKHEPGPVWLANKSVAELVQEALHHRDGNEYDLYAYCIMSNHVHLVFRLLNMNKPPANDSRLSDYPVTNIMQKLKSYTAVHANKILKRNGAFWHRESYDRVIRDAGELERTIAYTLNNPVKAGMVKRWKEWPYGYCKPAFLETYKKLYPEALLRNILIIKAALRCTRCTCMRLGFR